jgi:hypothetical protein
MRASDRALPARERRPSAEASEPVAVARRPPSAARNEIWVDRSRCGWWIRPFANRIVIDAELTDRMSPPVPSGSFENKVAGSPATLRERRFGTFTLLGP